MATGPVFTLDSSPCQLFMSGDERLLEEFRPAPGWVEAAVVRSVLDYLKVLPSEGSNARDWPGSTRC